MVKKNSTKEKLPKWIIPAFGFIAIIWGVSGFIIWYYFPDNQDRSTIGNMFGAINALFSGFAFLGVIITIYLQKKELEYQRIELFETKNELKRLAQAHENSVKALQSQVESSLIAAKIKALKILLDNSDFDSMNSTKTYFKEKDLLDEMN